MEISGNEEADKMAKKAVQEAPLTQLEMTSVMVKAIIHQHYRQQKETQLRADLKDNRKLRWYLETTGYFASTQRVIPARPVDRALRLLRMAVYPLHCVKDDIWTCQLCEGNFSVVHYLASCPATAAVRQPLMDLLTEDQHGCSDRDRARHILEALHTKNWQAFLPLHQRHPYVIAGDRSGPPTQSSQQTEDEQGSTVLESLEDHEVSGVVRRGQPCNVNVRQEQQVSVSVQEQGPPHPHEKGVT